MAAGKVAETAVEAVADVAEAVSEESEQVATAARLLSSHDLGLIVGGLGVGVAFGFAGGYFILRKRLETKYSQIADEEVAGMRAHYDQKLIALEQREEKGQLEGKLKTKVEELEYAQDPREGEKPIPYHKISEKPEVVVEEVDESKTKNIFDENKPEGDGILENMNSDWDYAEEIKSRDPKFPYVVHQDEHREGPSGDKDYEKVNLAYFEGDDVLADERDQIIEKKDEVVGVANLSKFGHGSGDPNIVYIRNDQLEADIEVVRSTGKYAIEVAGFKEDDLQHSGTMRRRLPRRSDFDDMER